MVEDEDLKALIRKVKEQSKKMSLQLNMKKTKVMATLKTANLPLMEKM